MDKETQKQLLARAADLVFRHLDRAAGRPVTSKLDPAIAAQWIADCVPEQGRDPDIVFADLESRILSRTMQVDHPRFFAYVPVPGDFVSALGDFIAAGTNVFAGSWQAASGPIAIERAMIQWLAEACGYGLPADGLFVSGGSSANLHGLATARFTRLGDNPGQGCVYSSLETHHSVTRALRVLGFDAEHRTRVGVDDNGRMRIDLLKESVRADEQAGKKPFCVVVSAGTTGTGVVDPLKDIAAFCKEKNLWLHVDGAYGAAVGLVSEGRQLLEDIELADSLSLDPHKWMFQTPEMGCILVRGRGVMKSAFAESADYLTGIHADPNELNPCDMGLQLTRSFRALKLWLYLQIHGAAKLRHDILHGLRMAETAERLIKKNYLLEVRTPAHLGIITFVFKCQEDVSDTVQTEIAKRIHDEGKAMLITTRVRGQTVLRLCCIHPETAEADIEFALDRVCAAGREVSSSSQFT